MEKFNIVVIGGGPGGYPAAIRAAQLGASVALIEKDNMGGTCLNTGCIPTKSLIASSNLFAQILSSREMGINSEKTTFDYSIISKRKDNIVSTLRSGINNLLKGNRIKTFKGTASFMDRNHIAIAEKKNNTIIKTDATIIATGSEPAIPKFLPESKLIMSSSDFLNKRTIPDSMIIMGGGVIGCEFACMAAQFGKKVIIVELLEDILTILDHDIRRELRNHMENKSGIKIITGKPLEKISIKKNKVVGLFNKTQIEAEMLLVATGRHPVTGKLHIEKADVKINESGFIPVDKFCRTNMATVYAVGDVTGGSQLAHAATSQGITAAENAYGGKRIPAETLVPSCIFTSPEISSVGRTEQDLKEKNIPYITGKFTFSSLGKAMTAGETIGFVKLIADKETDQVLGAHAIGLHATELISEATVAIRSELTLKEISKTIHCHPTLSEGWMEAAHAAHGQCIHATPSRRKK